MSFHYFAYGSNLWVPQMRSRCPSARVVGTGRLEGRRLVCDKPSVDGSAKFNLRPDPAAVTDGVIYEIEDGERQALDEAEPGYTPIGVEVAGRRALTYTYERASVESRPFDWYVAMTRLGASSHGLDGIGLDVDPVPDPIAPGVRPATTDDLDLIQSILSEGLVADTTRYYVHPGDYAWWVYHDDPRHPDHFSTWLQGDSGFVTIDSLVPHEINVFTRPGVDRMPLIRWAQRRLGGSGEIGWVAGTDIELVESLESMGYRAAAYANRWYRWNLDGELPRPELPPGWSLRPVSSEDEANNRRASAHAAFESTMPAAMHLQRYLNFMRSPVYVPERDLVAVSPNGTVGSFMVWWGDSSGVAQIEPFGTHPAYQRRGIGRALIYHGLAEMKAAGVHTARVLTDESRGAAHFYEGVGFEEGGRLRWWQPAIGS